MSSQPRAPVAGGPPRVANAGGGADLGPAPPGRPEGSTGTLPDGTRVVVRNGRIVQQPEIRSYEPEDLTRAARLSAQPTSTRFEQAQRLGAPPRGEGFFGREVSRPDQAAGFMREWRREQEEAEKPTPFERIRQPLETAREYYTLTKDAPWWARVPTLATRTLAVDIPTFFAADIPEAALKPPETPAEQVIPKVLPPGPAQGVLAAKRILVDPGAEMAAKAREAGEAGRPSEVLGYSAAAGVPFFGPMAAHIGEEIGKDPVSGLTQAAVLAGLPFAHRGIASRLRPIQLERAALRALRAGDPLAALEPAVELAALRGRGAGAPFLARRPGEVEPMPAAPPPPTGAAPFGTLGGDVFAPRHPRRQQMTPEPPVETLPPSEVTPPSEYARRVGEAFGRRRAQERVEAELFERAPQLVEPAIRDVVERAKPLIEREVFERKPAQPAQPAQPAPAEAPRQTPEGVPMPETFRAEALKPGERTIKRYRNPLTNQWTPERLAYHEQVFDSLFSGKTPVPEGQQPTIYVLGGGTASGKTTMSRAILGEQRGVLRLDPDEMKLRIPEYDGLKRSDIRDAARRVHDESTYMNKEALARAASRRLNVVYDTTTSGNGGPALIRWLKNKGYQVKVLFADVPLEVARERAIRRAINSKDPVNFGRVVPDKTIVKSHRGAARNFEEIRQLADEVRLYDNSGPEPVLIYERIAGGPERVYNQQRYEQYRQKGAPDASAVEQATATDRGIRGIRRPGPVSEPGGREGTGRNVPAGEGPPGLFPAERSAAAGVPAEATPLVGEGQVVLIPRERISLKPEKYQPREGLDKARVSALAEDMAQRGYDPAWPVDVWRNPRTGELELMAGHHRLAAAERAGIEQVPVRILERLNQDQAIEFARRSNSQPAPLKPMELARAFKAEAEAGRSPAEISRSYGGIKESAVQDHLALNNLPRELQNFVQDGTLDVPRATVMGKAVERHGLSPELMTEIFDKVVTKFEMTPTELTRMIDTLAPAAKQQMKLGLGFEMPTGFVEPLKQYLSKLRELNRQRRDLRGYIRAMERMEKANEPVSKTERVAANNAARRVARLEKEIKRMERDIGRGQAPRTLAEAERAGPVDVAKERVQLEPERGAVPEPRDPFAPSMFEEKHYRRARVRPPRELEEAGQQRLLEPPTRPFELEAPKSMPRPEQRVRRPTEEREPLLRQKAPEEVEATPIPADRAGAGFTQALFPGEVVPPSPAFERAQAALAARWRRSGKDPTADLAAFEDAVRAEVAKKSGERGFVDLDMLTGFPLLGRLFKSLRNSYLATARMVRIGAPRITEIPSIKGPIRKALEGKGETIRRAKEIAGEAEQLATKLSADAEFFLRQAENIRTTGTIQPKAVRPKVQLKTPPQPERMVSEAMFERWKQTLFDGAEELARLRKQAEQSGSARQARVLDAAERKMGDLIAEYRQTRRAWARAGHAQQRPAQPVSAQAARELERLGLALRQATKPRTGLDMLYEFWINALLSGPQTHLINFLDNTLMRVLAPAEKLAAGLAALPAGRQRPVFVGEALADVIGATVGLKQGFRNALTAFVTGKPAGVTKMELPAPAIPGKVGEGVRSPSRGLTAEDAFFETINASAEIYSRAYRRAAQEGLRGRALAERMAELIQESPAWLEEAAREAALYRTLKADIPEPLRFVKQLRQTEVGRYIIPFARVSTNILTYGVERTPAMLPKIIRDALKSKRGPELYEAIGRMATGTMLSGLFVYYLADEGIEITGAGPKQASRRAALREVGWQPYSIRIGDRYYSYNRFGGYGIVLGATGDLMDLWDDRDEAGQGELAGRLALIFSQNLLSKTWMTGLRDFVDALFDPPRYAEQWVNRWASSWVPNLMGQLARAKDPKLRAPETIIEEMKQRIPGKREELPVRRGIFGEEIETDPGMSFLWRFVMPIRVSQRAEDPVRQEIARLAEDVPEFGLTRARKEFTFDRERQEMTRAEFDQYQREAGDNAHKWLEQLIAHPAYKRMEDEERVEEIRNILNAARRFARDRILQQRHQQGTLQRRQPPRVRAVGQ